MLTSNALALVAERLANPIEQNTEVILVLDELENVDNHVPRARIRHDARDLTHLVTPEFSQILVEVAPDLAPQLESPRRSRCPLLDFEDG